MLMLANSFNNILMNIFFFHKFLYTYKLIEPNYK